MMAVSEKNKKRERELRERELSANNVRPIRVNGGKVAPNDTAELDTRSSGTGTTVSGHTGTPDIGHKAHSSAVIQAHRSAAMHAHCHWSLGWGESTIFRDKDSKWIDPYVFGCATSSGGAGF